MAGPERAFHKKTPSELRQQLKQAIAQLGNTSLAPPSVEKELFKLNESELKARHPRRYEMYTSLLRGHATNPSAWFGYKAEKDSVLGLMDIARMRKWLTALNNLDNYIESHKTGDIETLRERQATVFEDMRNFVEKGGDAGYVKLPTGSGKTVLFAEFVEALDLRTLIVVPTKLLVDQTEQRLQQFAPELDVGVVRSGRKKDLSKQCTVITAQGLTTKVNSGEINPSDYDLLILDEAHTVLSGSRINVVNQFQNSLKIGFTATPDYSAQKGVNKLLEAEIHRMNIKEAVVEEGLLSGFQCILAKTETDLSKIKIIGGEKYDERELETAVNNVVRNKAAVDLYKQMFAGHMGVAYCVGVDHAGDLAAMFEENGVAAEVISGRTSDGERQRILERYESGEIKVLCNADLLITGFDQPKATVCLNLRPTLSAVVAEQRGGRVLRLDENDEEKIAYIVDFVDIGHDPRYYPTLFAEVAEETALLRKGRLGLGRYKKLDITIEGLSIETDPTTLQQLIKGIQQGREKIKKLKWEDFLREVWSVPITSFYHYRDYQREERRDKWPADPSTFKPYIGKWVSWEHLFQQPERVIKRRKKEPLPKWRDLVREVRSVGITSARHYNQERDKHGWPSEPGRQSEYEKHWKDWDSFLDKKKVRTHSFGFPKNMTLTERQEQLRRFIKKVHDENILSEPEYKRRYKALGLPRHPDRTFKGIWKGWSYVWTAKA